MKRIHKRINSIMVKMAANIKNTVILVSEDRLLLIYVLSALLLSLIVKLSSGMALFNVRSFLFNISWYSLFIAFSFLFKKHKGRMIYFIVITSLSYIVSFANILYYSYYDTFLSLSLVKQLSLFAAMPDTGDMGTELISLYDVALWFLFISTLFFYSKYSKRNKESYEGKCEEVKRNSRRTFYRTAGIAFFTGILFLQGAQYSQVTKMWNRPIVVENFGLVNYHIVDTFKSASLFIEPKLSEDDYEKFLEYFEDDIKVNNQYTGIFENKNVIVIHAESIEKFMINKTFEGQVITPNFNKLANEGYYYSNVYSQESVGTSSDSEFTFSTSLLPVNNGTIFLTHFNRTYQTTQKLLQEKGYSTVSMHGNNGSFWNRAIMHPQLGYQEFFDKKYYEPIQEKDTIGLGISDEVFFERSVDLLSNISEPYYATLITLTNHTPWKATDQYITYNDLGEEEDFKCGELKGEQMCDYFQAVRYADYAVGQFMDGLENQKMLDDSIIVVYGDHPANLNISDLEVFYGTSKLSKLEYEAQQQIPFIIWSKDIVEPQEFDQVIGMMDASAILQNMLGINNPFKLGKDYPYDFSSEDLIVDIYDESSAVLVPSINIEATHIVPFINGDWTDGIIFYDSFRKDYYLLNKDIAKDLITKDYIKLQTDRAEAIITMSNLINKYNIIDEYYERQEALIELGPTLKYKKTLDLGRPKNYTLKFR